MDFFKGKTVVVTGGAGFIGSHLCERLLDLNAKVIAVDNLCSGQQANIQDLLANPDFSFIQADVTQAPESYLPSSTNIDLILHFASLASPPLYQAKPIETYLANSLGTHLLLQFLHQNYPQARFLFASTSEVYGDPLEHPQKETYWGNVNPNGLRSCYDESKRLGETICGVHQRNLGMDVRIVRIFNTYGPHLNLRDGRVISEFIRQILSHTPVTIYGNGQQTRSFCYVDDLVEGILRLAALSSGSGQTVNLGNPQETNMLQVVELIQDITQLKSKVVFEPLPSDDPVRRKPDISLAKQLLKWEPQIDLRTGLSKTLAYFTNLSELAK